MSSVKMFAGAIFFVCITAHADGFLDVINKGLGSVINAVAPKTDEIQEGETKSAYLRRINRPKWNEAKYGPPLKALSGEELCSRVQRFSGFKEYSGFAARIANDHDKEYVFDTKDEILRRWINEKIKNLTEEKNGSYDSDKRRLVFEWMQGVEQSANECAFSLKDSPLLYIFADKDSAYKELKNGLDEVGVNLTPKKIRKIDATGQIVVVDAPVANVSKDVIGRYAGVRSFPIDGLNAMWIPVWMVAFDEDGALLQSVYPDIKAETVKRLADLDGKKASYLAELERENKQRNLEKANQAAIAARQTKLAAENEAYLATPAGKLQLAYGYFQIISTCVDARKGMAALYISPAIYSRFKERVKLFENKIAPSLKGKGKDDIWVDAENENKSGGGFDNFEVVRNASFSQGQRLCSAMSVTLDDHLNSVLGKEVVKKDF